MTTPDLTTLSGFTASPPPQPYSPSYSSAPPPPPPKPSSSAQTPTHSSPQPRDPPPIPSTHPSQPNPSQPIIPSGPPPPEPHEHWLPEVVLDKTFAQLSALLTSPPLLLSLSHLHPSLSPSTSPLPPLLQQTANLATHVSAQHTRLLSLRQQTQTQLLTIRALERQWRDKQAMLDKELEPWSAKNLYEGLRAREREEEEVGVVGEGSWLDGSGGGERLWGEREVEEWVRGWREGRAKGWKRREERERWDEGRVGGWR